MIRYKKKVARYAAALLTVCSVSQLLGAPNSFADETRVRKKFQDKIMVVQPKPVLQRNRLELIPVFRASVNDPVVASYSVGAELNFHILESLYVGAGFDWADFGSSFGGYTKIGKELERSLAATSNGVIEKYFAYGQIGYVPIMGKLAIFNSAIGYYDAAITVGGGWINYAAGIENKPMGTFAGVIGITGRAFLSDWFALTLSLRDSIFVAKFKNDDKSKPNKPVYDNSLSNIVSVGIGCSIYIPFSFKYSQSELTGEGSLNVANNED